MYKVLICALDCHEHIRELATVADDIFKSSWQLSIWLQEPLVHLTFHLCKVELERPMRQDCLTRGIGSLSRECYGRLTFLTLFVAIVGIGRIERVVKGQVEVRLHPGGVV